MRYNYRGAHGGSRYHPGGLPRAMTLTKMTRIRTVGHLPWETGMLRLSLLNHRGINLHRVADPARGGKRGSRRNPPDSVSTSRGKPDVNERGAETPPVEISPTGATNREPAVEKGVKATKVRANTRNAGGAMPPQAGTTDPNVSGHGGAMPPKAVTTTAQRERSRGRESQSRREQSRGKERHSRRQPSQERDGRSHRGPLRDRNERGGSQG